MMQTIQNSCPAGRGAYAETNPAAAQGVYAETNPAAAQGVYAETNPAAARGVCAETNPAAAQGVCAEGNSAPRRYLKQSPRKNPGPAFTRANPGPARKHRAALLTAITAAALLAGACQDALPPPDAPAQNGMSKVTIVIGSQNARTFLPTILASPAITYKAYFTGPETVGPAELAIPQDGTLHQVSKTLKAGTWTIAVQGTRDNVPFCEGSETLDITTNRTVNITMKPVFGSNTGTLRYTGILGTSSSNDYQSATLTIAGLREGLSTVVKDIKVSQTGTITLTAGEYMVTAKYVKPNQTQSVKTAVAFVYAGCETVIANFGPGDTAPVKITQFLSAEQIVVNGTRINQLRLTFSDPIDSLQDKIKVEGAQDDQNQTPISGIEVVGVPQASADRKTYTVTLSGVNKSGKLTVTLGDNASSDQTPGVISGVNYNYEIYPPKIENIPYYVPVTGFFKKVTNSDGTYTLTSALVWKKGVELDLPELPPPLGQNPEYLLTPSNNAAAASELASYATYDDINWYVMSSNVDGINPSQTAIQSPLTGNSAGTVVLHAKITYLTAPTPLYYDEQDFTIRIIDAAEQNLKTKFAVTAPGPQGVTAVFNAIHGYLPGVDDDDIDLDEGTIGVINVGDYIDLDSITVGDSTVYNTDISPATPPFSGYEGKLLRLIVVGIDSFSSATPPVDGHHLVFQFQNAPFTGAMGNASCASYSVSALRQYLARDLLPGIIAAGVPDARLIAPSRIIGTAAISDPLWLPQKTDMLEVTSGTPALFTYYKAGAGGSPSAADKLKKYTSANAAVRYWLADPVSAGEFSIIATSGAAGTVNTDNANIGISPAFCIR
ncbi:MAG: hypothetical protein LBG87_02650 [Spirochaetaceae bacterium]|jgi:hypothetical protein|nr:hypothetical protein [Spirochaetaceae bacterium]